MKTLNKEQLIAFENDIAECFNNKQIRAPIHLQNGCEDDLISIFEDINEEDWCCGSWRFHYERLLKGVKPEVLKQAIRDGRSISLCFKEQRIITSAIVGGILPIALGLAMDIKRKNGTNKVFCFLGDMSSETGVFAECFKYAVAHKLPITFVVADNGKSVMTNTKEVWNIKKTTMEDLDDNFECKWLIYYQYDGSKWAHSGTNIRVQF